MDATEQRRSELRTALAEEWEYELQESPEFATIIGDYRYNDRWSDLSLDHAGQHRRDLAAWLSRFEAMDTTGFPEQEELDHRLMVRNLTEGLRELELKNHEMPVDQLDGIHLMLAHFVTNIPFATVEHYEQYLSRLTALPKLLAQVIELLKQGERDGLMPPRPLLEKAAVQAGNIAAPAGDANVFGRPASTIPTDIPAATRARLREALIAAVDGQVRPAYEQLATFIAEDYAPKGRTHPGVWSLPQGDARYRFEVQKYTTTDMCPEEIHALGLEEVSRIEAEQTAIARSLGASDLRSFRASLKTNGKLFATSREQLLEAYRGYIERMQPRLPELFGLLPKTPLEVRPVQEFREKEAAAAEYNPGTPDGSRPGMIYVNTGGHETRSLFTVEATAYHEAVPGHHLQTAIAQTLPGLPAFRQHGYYGAYIEGWALYSERLGKEIGFYQDPYSDFGRLAEELLRAVRLVLDTGVHHGRWSREQMVDYFREHSDEAESDIQAETDRYIVLPAQALSYKLGQLKILDLRARAQLALGPRYDSRAFHDAILDGGALPLDVLDTRITAWIERQKGKSL